MLSLVPLSARMKTCWKRHTPSSTSKVINSLGLVTSSDLLSEVQRRSTSSRTTLSRKKERKSETSRKLVDQTNLRSI